MNQYFLIALVIAVIVYQLVIRKFGIANKVKITPADAKSRLDKDKKVILLDVRTRNEYQNLRIPKSMLIPVNILADVAPKKLPDKEAEIIVYCATGSRSARAVRILKKSGYNNIYNLGGLNHWPYQTTASG